ncbi:MAG: P7, partial [Panacromy virus 1]
YNISLFIRQDTRSIITKNGIWYRNKNIYSKLDQNSIVERTKAVNVFSKIESWTKLLLSNDTLNISESDVGTILNLFNVPGSISNDLVSDSNYVIGDTIQINNVVVSAISINNVKNDLSIVPWFAILFDIIDIDFSFINNPIHLGALKLLIFYGFRYWFTNIGDQKLHKTIGPLSSYNQQNAFENGDEYLSTEKIKLLPSIFTSLLPVNKIKQVLNTVANDLLIL